MREATTPGTLNVERLTGGDERVFVKQTKGRKFAWLAADGSIRTTTGRQDIFEMPRCPAGAAFGLGRGSTVEAVAWSIAADIGYTNIWAAAWPDWVGIVFLGDVVVNDQPPESDQKLGALGGDSNIPVEDLDDTVHTLRPATADSLIAALFAAQNQLRPDEDPGDVAIGVQDDMPLVTVVQRDTIIGFGGTVLEALENALYGGKWS